jgi:copper chaperone CopZ
MTHTYILTGMTCGNCESKVKSALLSIPNVLAVEVSKDDNTATIEMEKHISLSDLQNALGLDGKYKISSAQHSEAVEQTKSWLATYKPLLIIFAFITGISLITASAEYKFDAMLFMRNFMAGFFLTFSFFKLLDIKAFAETYSMYDIVAKKIKVYAFIYPFIELALGIAYIINFNPFVTNLTALTIMSISLIGVLQSVLNKQKIQCACLGAVFNLPMSTVTIIEDALMIAMSASMLFLM